MSKVYYNLTVDLLNTGTKVNHFDLLSKKK